MSMLDCNFRELILLVFVSYLLDRIYPQIGDDNFKCALWTFKSVISLNNRAFTNSLQNENANIANFVLAVPLESNWNDEVTNLKT